MTITNDYAILIGDTIGTSRWRAKQAEKFPHDRKRNTEASHRLAELALTPFSAVDPAVWQELAPLTEAGYFQEACSDVTKSIGFRFHPKDMNDVVREVANYARGYELRSGRTS